MALFGGIFGGFRVSCTGAARVGTRRSRWTESAPHSLNLNLMINAQIESFYHRQHPFILH